MAKIETPSGIPEDDFLREGLIDRLRQFVEADPGAWHIRYNLGVALAHDNRTDEAIEHFKLVLRDAPRHLESTLNLGGLYLAKGDPDMALRTFTSALTVWDIPAVRANIAVAYLQLGRLEDAERELRRALAENDKMPDAWTNLSSVLVHKGDFADAVAAAERALAIDDNFAMAHNNKAVALLELGCPEESKKAARRARELGYPVHPDML